MATVNFDSEKFIEVLEPGIVSFIVNSYKKRLEEKVNNAVKEVYEELEKELPNKVKAKIVTAFHFRTDEREVKVIVDFRSNEKEPVNTESK